MNVAFGSPRISAAAGNCSAITGHSQLILRAQSIRADCLESLAQHPPCLTGRVVPNRRVPELSGLGACLWIGVVGSLRRESSKRVQTGETPQNPSFCGL